MKPKPDGVAGELRIATAKFGKPLPEMTAPDYDKRKAEFDKRWWHNKSVVDDYDELSGDLKNLAESVGKKIDVVTATFNENLSIWNVADAIMDETISAQADFKKNRVKNPAVAERLVKEAEDLHKKVAAMIEKKLKPNYKKWSEALGSAQDEMKVSAGKILKTMEEHKKRAKK